MSHVWRNEDKFPKSRGEGVEGHWEEGTVCTVAQRQGNVVGLTAGSLWVKKWERKKGDGRMWTG